MNKIILGGIVTVIAGSILAATAWNFSAVASVPENYVSKEDQKTFIERNDKEHGEIKRKLDMIIQHLINEEG